MSRLVSVILVLVVTLVSCNWLDRDHSEASEHSDHGEASESDSAGRSESEAQGVRVIELSEQALKHISLGTEVVGYRDIVEPLRLSAEVQPDPDRIAHITPLVASQVTEVKVRPGDKVEKGQVLALLKSVQLGEARADVAQAKAALDVARDQFSRQEQLKASGIGAEKSYVEAQGAVKQAEAALAAAHARASVYGGTGGSGATTVLRSPLKGTVVERHATAGEVATPERQLFVIAEIDPVWVVGRAYESDLPMVQSGSPARVRVKAYADRSWDGVIDYVSPTLSERTRTAEVRIVLENGDGVLKPGMFATISPTANAPGKEHRALALPRSALQRDGDRHVVFVALGDRRFESRTVTLGTQGSDYVRVLDGLREGETVVTEGAFILKSEAAKHQMGGGHSH